MCLWVGVDARGRGALDGGATLERVAAYDMARWGAICWSCTYISSSRRESMPGVRPVAEAE